MKSSSIISIQSISKTFRAALIASMFVFLGARTYAQTTVPEKVDVNINTGSGDAAGWYTQPWVWILGVAVFIIIIIAITRGGRAPRDV